MSKAVLPLLSLAALLLPLMALAGGDLPQHHGKNRVLLIFASSRNDPRWRTQNARLQNGAAAFQDRDLVRQDDLEGEGPHRAALRKRYGVKAGEFRVLLIGKDGHVASASSAPISLRSLTAQIDQMPMRREEMRRRGR